jgi:hypothetical protein
MIGMLETAFSGLKRRSKKPSVRRAGRCPGKHLRQDIDHLPVAGPAARSQVSAGEEKPGELLRISATARGRA